MLIYDSNKSYDIVIVLNNQTPSIKKKYNTLTLTLQFIEHLTTSVRSSQIIVVIVGSSPLTEAFHLVVLWENTYF